MLRNPESGFYCTRVNSVDCLGTETYNSLKFQLDPIWFSSGVTFTSMSNDLYYRFAELPTYTGAQILSRSKESSSIFTVLESASNCMLHLQLRMNFLYKSVSRRRRATTYETRNAICLNIYMLRPTLTGGPCYQPPLKTYLTL